MKPITARQAEKLRGCRLDRRMKYAVHNRQVFSLGTWVQSCSGCHETMDGHEIHPVTRDKNGVVLGGGCSECGYQGKVRVSMWLPLSDVDEKQ